MMKKIIQYFIIFIMFIVTVIYTPVLAYGYDDYEDAGIDIEKLDNVMIDETEGRFSFSEILTDIVSGDKGIIGNIVEIIKEAIVNEFSYHKDTLIKIIAIAIFLALLSNVMVVFSNSDFSETGFFIVYLLLVEVLIATFINMINETSSLITSVMSFMHCLVPAFFLSVGLSTGITTSTGMCAITLTVMTVVEFIICKILLPVISIYVTLSLVSIVSKENSLSKMGEAIYSFVNWSVRTLVGVILGLNVIKCMILPSADMAGSKTLTGIVSMIPIIGNTVGGASKLLVSSGTVIRNSIGGAGVVALVIIGLIPIVKLLVYMLLYKIMTIIVEPISDKRVVDAIEVIFKGAGMLYKVCIASIILFAASIAVVCTMT